MDNTALEREFDMLMAKSGVVVPTDRRAGALSGYADSKQMTRLLRQPRTAESEPSNLYSLSIVLRTV
jgi:hypothetical protein